MIMKKLIGYTMFWIAVGMVLMLIISDVWIAVIIIAFLLIVIIPEQGIIQINAGIFRPLFVIFALFLVPVGPQIWIAKKVMHPFLTELINVYSMPVVCLIYPFVYII